MILETIVTTVDAEARPNAAPMGVRLEEGTIVLRPFRSAVTCRNLEAVGEGVVNFTDNVLLFARCALTPELPPHRPATRVRGVILEDACHWREFALTSAETGGERATFRARAVAEGRSRDLLAFNRAQHAVVEATILATRLHLLDPGFILGEMERLRPLVDKTGGEREREAFAFIESAVRAARPAQSVR